MLHLSLRRATPADAVIVRDITRAAYAKWVAVIGREPKPMTADYDHAIAAHLIDILEEDGKPFGLIECIPAPSHLLIENIAVLPPHQGMGIGDRLLVHAEKLAAALGRGELQLYTNAAFASNIAFYAHRGFSVFLRAPIPGGGEVVHMKKSLAP